MSELEILAEQQSNEMDAQTFLDMSIAILEQVLGKEQAGESIAWLRESQGDREALASKMMGIVLDLPKDQQQKFFDATGTLESQAEKS